MTERALQLLSAARNVMDAERDGVEPTPEDVELLKNVEGFGKPAEAGLETVRDIVKLMYAGRYD